MITLKKTKGQREDVMPLPEALGIALVDYLKFERPKTINNRSVFVRNAASQEHPITYNFIRYAICQAYAHAGLPYTRVHLLRHTMAGRLLEKGSSLKEIADVLRHRSLSTTMIYAKLDSRNLVEVALPWPGSSFRFCSGHLLAAITILFSFIIYNFCCFCRLWYILNNMLICAVQHSCIFEFFPQLSQLSTFSVSILSG